MRLHPGEVFVDFRRIDDQQIAVFADAIDDQIIDDAAAFIEQKGVLAFAHVEPLDVIGQQTVQPRRRAGAGDKKLPHVRDVEDAQAFPHRVMLVDDAGVLHGHRPAAKLDHPAAESYVFGKKRRLFRRNARMGRHGGNGRRRGNVVNPPRRKIRPRIAPAPVVRSLLFRFRTPESASASMNWLNRAEGKYRTPRS